MKTAILKDEINKKTAEEKLKKIKSIDFTKKEKQIEITEPEISDDDIPF